MNPILSQLPKAQDAYTEVVKSWDVDTTDILLHAGSAIREAVEKGHLCAFVAGIPDMRVVEKAAIELSELGYRATTIQTGQAIQSDQSIKPLYGISINFKYLPDNTRDDYTV